MERWAGHAQVKLLNCPRLPHVRASDFQKRKELEVLTKKVSSTATTLLSFTASFRSIPMPLMAHATIAKASCEFVREGAAPTSPKRKGV